MRTGSNLTSFSLLACLGLAGCNQLSPVDSMPPIQLQPEVENRGVTIKGCELRNVILECVLTNNSDQPWPDYFLQAQSYDRQGVRLHDFPITGTNIGPGESARAIVMSIRDIAELEKITVSLKEGEQ